jgi:ABC-type multidrug transport system permease subunit
MINRIFQEFFKFYGYLKKDFLLLFKRKKYLYLSLIVPFLLGLVFILIITPSSNKIDVGICDLDKTDYSREIYSSLGGFNGIVIDNSNCTLDLVRRMEFGEFPLGIVIPEGFSYNLENLKQSEVIIYYDNTDLAFSNMVSWRVDNSLSSFKRNLVDSLNNELKTRIGFMRENMRYLGSISLGSRVDREINSLEENLRKIESMETEFIVNPIRVSHNPLFGNKNVIDIGIVFVFPIISLFILLMLASSSLIYDVKTGFINSIRSSTSVSLYLLAKLLFFLGVTIFQFLIVLSIFLLYGASLSFNFLGILQLLLFVSFIDVLIGLLIGVFSENEGIAILFSLLLSFPLMLLSGIFYPTQALPKLFQWMESILPLSYQIEATKKVLLFGNNYGFGWIYSALILFVIVWFGIKKKV